MIYIIDEATIHSQGIYKVNEIKKDQFINILQEKKDINAKICTEIFDKDTLDYFEKISKSQFKPRSNEGLNYYDELLFIDIKFYQIEYDDLPF